MSGILHRALNVRLAVLGLGLLLLGSQCRSPEVAREGHWVSVSLLASPPTPAEGWEVVETPLGAREVRDLELLTPVQVERIPRQSASFVEAVQVRSGARVSWPLSLGSEATFSFVALPSEDQSCEGRQRVTVRSGGRGEELVYDEPVPDHRHPAPRPTVIELGAWSGSEVEVELELVADEELCEALWASPTVVSFEPEPPGPRGATGGPPNILLIGADTLRADALGVYGRAPSPTPALDRFATESDVWERAFSCFNVTNPSFVSLFTGLYGKNHGIYDLRTPLPDEQVTLTELLQQSGYETHAVVSVRHLGSHNSGLGQGFEGVDLSAGQTAAGRAVEQALAFLDGERDRPFFLWLHLFDPHTPHTPPLPFAHGLRPRDAPGLAPVRTWAPFRALGPRSYSEVALAGQEDLYLGEVAYLDRELGRLFDYLRQQGLLASTLVVFVADHGENMEEHGVRYRHSGLFDSTTHVPLLIRWPGRTRTGRRFPGLVQNVDLFPTLLEAAGIDPPESDGEALGVAASGGHRGRRAVFAEHANREGIMVRTATHKYIRSFGNTFLPDGVSLFDLRQDPLEVDNLAGRNLPEEEELSTLLDRWLIDRRERSFLRSRELSDEDAGQLRALGYL